MIEFDDHHLFHRRAEYEATPEGEHLRGLVVAHHMLRGWHERLHRETSPVPVPLFHSLQWVSRRMQDHGNVFSNIDQACFLLEAANHLKYVKPLEVRTNYLCIEGLRDQLPYVRSGIHSTTVIDLGHHHE